MRISIAVAQWARQVSTLTMRCYAEWFFAPSRRSIDGIRLTIGLVISAVIGRSMPVFAAPMSPLDSQTATGNMAQVTAVSQLRDVQPTDWAFPALQSLVERYGCVVGYPEGTYRGHRTLTRNEFAAGLNACVQQVNALLEQAGTDVVQPADLATLQKLQQEFAPELAILQGRVDRLEGKATMLSGQAFSTTTQLYGQTVVGLQGSNQTNVDFFPRDGLPERQGQAKTTFGYNVQLSLATSFRGSDLLLVGLQTGNLRSNAPTLFSNMGRLGYESEANGQLLLSDLSYRFAVGPNLGVIVGPTGVNPENTFRGINPLEGYGEGALSQFGQRNPIIGLGNTNGGVGFDWQVNDRVSLQGVYSATLGALPSQGLVDAGRTIGTQLTLAPTANLDIGLNYLYSHSPNGVIGPGVGDAQVLSPFAPDASGFDTHAVGATLAWRINPGWTIGTWGGWTRSQAIAVPGSVETTNWMAFSAFPDLFSPGNLGAVMIGQPPKITRSDLPDGLNFPKFSTDGSAGGQPHSALHVEAFYRAKLSSKISVTPGLLLIFNPNHNQHNGTLVQGLVRANYQF